MSLKGFEFVELEYPINLAVVGSEINSVVLPANAAHFPMQTIYRIPAAVKNASSLSHRDLGRQKLEQLQAQVGAPVSISEAKGLAGELLPTTPTKEAWNSAAVTLAAIVTLPLVVEVCVTL